VRAAWRANSTANLTPEEFYRRIDEVDPSALPAGPMDLLIRPEGVIRLGNFMLWECAYAELHFVECPWRDSGEERFVRALNEYYHFRRLA
jgi:undecaprenyl diphosphate synthase